MTSQKQFNNIYSYLICAAFALWVSAFVSPDDFLNLNKVTNLPFSTFIIMTIIPKLGLGFFFLTLIRRQPYASLVSLVLMFAFPITFTIRWFITG